MSDLRMSDLVSNYFFYFTGFFVGAVGVYVLTRNNTYNVRLDLNIVPHPSNDTCDVNLEEEEVEEFEEEFEEEVEEEVEEEEVESEEFLDTDGNVAEELKQD